MVKKSIKAFLVSGSLVLTLLCASFQFTFATNYYWVGGTGNWSDINHWATTSGGTSLQSIVPSLNDNVIFDANSGFTATLKSVTINTNALCDSMTWSGAAIPPQLFINNPLQVKGSLKIQAGMQLLGSSTITFVSTRANESITTGNVSIPYPLIFNSTGGWTLTDSLKNFTSAIQSITFTNGNLNFGGQFVSVNSFSSVGGNTTRTLNIANSLITTFNGWTYTGGVALTAPNSAGSVIIGSFISAKTGDVYYNAQMNGNSIIQGIYNKVTYTAGMSSPSVAINTITTDSLILAPGKVFNFTSNVTTTVNKYFQGSTPACSGLIEMYATNQSNQATMQIGSTAVVSVANARIGGLKIQGAGAPYAASNSIDQGNNTGWAFTAPTVHTYYWVGASGNWNDVNHWATTSGGTAASGCVPTQFDEVIFDAGSGFTASNKTVTVDGNAYCDSMTWSGITPAPTFTISNPLQIYGSLRFEQGMSLLSNATITFASSRAGESITMGNNTTASAIIFNGTGGWLLMDTLKTTVTVPAVTLTNGNLNFNGQYAAINGYNSTGTTAILNIANSTIVLTNPWQHNGAVALTAPNSANSLIIAPSLATKTGDVYNNVQIGGGSISRGIYNKVTYTAGMNSSSAILAITADSLLLAPGKAYYFSTIGTNTINKYFLASSPPCSGLIEMYSSNAGTQATINIGSTAIVSVANARIRDIKIQGAAAPYAATSSIDLGNNAGWTFTTPSAHTYYWVGASGNWNDATHWATTSGGTPGSGCVPTQFDEVIFDGGSGFTAGNKTVTVDGNAFCDSMTWNGIITPPTFTISNPLQIYGSLKFQQGMALTSNGAITFASSRSNESISMGGASTASQITFNGTGGWSLMDTFRVTGTVYAVTFTNGNLNFNGQYAAINGFNGLGGNTTRTLNIANATIVLTNPWNYTGGAPLTTVNSANSLIVAPSVNAKAGDVYHNAQISTGTITQGIYNKVTATGSITINTINTDTLIFASNNTYTFTSGTTTLINKAWYASGNPCFATTIQSSIAGSVANVSMPSTAANMPPNTYGIDFVRMRDINAVTGAGRATMQIGNQSVDNGNNTNWVIIPYAGPAGITGLGHDTTLYCNSFPYTLSTIAFQGNPSTTYLWDNNSNGFTRTVTDTGHYNVTVNYGNGCVIKDTIALSKVTNPVLTSQTVINGTNYDVTLTAAPLTGTPVYTLDSVAPSGAMTTPVVQASSLFVIPNTVTMAAFRVTDQTSGCTAALKITGTPLPVNLISFSGVRNNGNDHLFWTTAAEKNTRQFEIEYNADASSFKNISIIPAAGNSTVTQRYNFTHQNINSDAWYRLKIVDMDGSFSYSNIIKLSGNDHTQACVVLNNISPVPFTGELNINISSCKDQPVGATIFDVKGNRLLQTTIKLQEGTHSYILEDLQKIPAGVLLLHFTTEDGTIIIQKIVK